MTKTKKLKLISKLSEKANVMFRAGKLENGLRLLRAIHLIASTNITKVQFETFDL